MDLLPSPEQTEITTSSAAFIADRVSIERTRQRFEGGELPAIDPEAWSAAAELGWFALGLPERLGGVGCGMADEALLFVEIGRGIAPGPFVSTVLAARVAAFGGRTGLADEIAGGRRVGLVVPDAGSVDADGSIVGPVQLLDATDGLALVVTPEAATIIDVASLVAPPSDVTCIDPTARLQRTAGRGVTPLAAVSRDVDPIESRGRVLVAAMLAGITAAVRDIGSRHAIDRVQFDRPIGVNQAIKHPCADMAVQAQLAYAQTLFAALAIDEHRPDVELHALSAHLVGTEAATMATAATIQILGGMGFTHEHDAHLYMKRVHLLTHVLGGTAPLPARLLELPEPV